MKDNQISNTSSVHHNQLSNIVGNQRIQPNAVEHGHVNPIDEKNIWLKFIKIGLNYPLKLLKTFNLDNINILIKALRQEPPAQILRNFQHLLFYGSKEVIKRNKNILVACSKVNCFSNKIEISGWAYSENGIRQVTVKANGTKTLGIAKYGLTRLDIKQRFLKQMSHNNVGYQLVANIDDIDEPINFVEISVVDEKGFLCTVINSGFYRNLGEQYKTHLHHFEKKTVYRKDPLPLSATIVVYALDKEWDEVKWQRTKLSINKQQKNNCSTIITTSQYKELSDINSSIKVVALDNINQALQKETSDYIFFVKAGDILKPDALSQLSSQAEKTAAVIYSDEEFNELNPDILPQPNYKPDLNKDLLLSFNYIGSTTAIRRDIGEQIGWFRSEIGISLYDLYLRILRFDKTFLHIPDILYETASAPTLPTDAQALKYHLEKEEIKAGVELGLIENTFRVRRRIRSTKEVTIVIPFKDDPTTLKTCVESILAKTAYPNYRILLVSNESKDTATFELLEELSRQNEHIDWIEYNFPFNYSQINNWAIKQCETEWVLLLNNDTEVIGKGWLRSMVEHIQREDIGAVGAKLLYPDDTVQHAGVIIGINGVADHIHKLYDSNDIGYFNRLNVIQNYSACTAACLMIKKSLFEKVNGFDEKNLRTNFNDTDFCLKLITAGYNIVYTPFAKLYHYESKSRGSNVETKEKKEQEESEIRFFRKKWKPFLDNGDPSYNPNLTLTRKDFSLRSLE